jgi:hypothetical protein
MSPLMRMIHKPVNGRRTTKHAVSNDCAVRVAYNVKRAPTIWRHHLETTKSCKEKIE